MCHGNISCVSLYTLTTDPLFQTITGAMSTLTPPLQLENPENQHRFDYIQDVASQHDFDYPSVSCMLHFTNNYTP